jgi:predicted ATPase
MLKRIKITNFLSCQDTEIDFENVTALIGRNAAGKTNILKIIEWVAKFAIGKFRIYVDTFVDYPKLEQFISIAPMTTAISLDFFIDNSLIKYDIGLSKKNYDEDYNLLDDEILIEKISIWENDTWLLKAERKDSAASYNDIKFEINYSRALIESILAFIPDKDIKPYIHQIYQYFSKFNYYTLNNEQIKTKDYYLFDERLYQKWLNYGTEYDAIMCLVHLWNERQETLNELKELIGQNGLNLIKDIVIKKESLDNKQKIYIVEFDIDDNTTVKYNQLSFGTQRILSLLLAILYDKSTTLLLEQPEDGIHLSLLKKVIHICVQYADVYNKQLIIATHSADVINLLKPESIRLVRMTEAGTKVSGLDKQQLPLILDYINNEGTLANFIEAMDDE